MSDELPEGWATAPLDSLCDRLRGVSYQRDDASPIPKPGHIPIVRANNIEADALRFEDLVWIPKSRVSEKQMIRKGDVVIAMSSGSKSVVGKTAQALDDWEGAFGAFCGVLRISPELNNRYLGMFLRTRAYRSKISELSAGSNINNLKAEHFTEIEVPLAPLAEQRRIVAKLTELLGKVDACQQRLAKIPVLLKRFRQSVLASACSGRLTADWREENPNEDVACLIEAVRTKRPAKFQDASVREDLDLSEIPETWVWANLRFLLSSSEAFCYGVVQPGERDPNGVFLVRAGDLNGGRVDMSALRRIPKRIHQEYRRSQLSGGEVLVTVVGAGIGESAIAQPECAGFNIARAVAKLPVREFEARYVHLWLNTSRAVTWMKGDAREVARPTLNLEQLQTLPVPVPPLAEQQEIVRRVEGLFALADQIEARFNKAQAQVDKLTPSLLARAFRGQLVPQDPTDEPAATLLARLRHHTISR